MKNNRESQLTLEATHE
jgi:hypothetical protein